MLSCVKQKAKEIISIFLIGVMCMTLFGLTGCANESGESGGSSSVKVSYPASLPKYYEVPPITIMYDSESYEDENGEEQASGDEINDEGSGENSGDKNAEEVTFPVTSHETVSIAGLADHDVLEKINARIEEVRDELAGADVPKYRGIRKQIPENSILVEENIYFYETALFNNVLSLKCDRACRWVIPDENGQVTPDLEDYDYSAWTNETLSATFDLTTGNEITLEDLFTDNTDYLKVIDDEIKKYLMNTSAYDEDVITSYEAYVSLAGPYESVKENQHFYITPEQLCIVVDQHTPQYDVDFFPQAISIYWSDIEEYAAIFERYNSPEWEIYTTGAEKQRTLVELDLGQIESTKENEILTSGSIQLSSTYPAGMPDEVMKKTSSMEGLLSEQETKVRTAAAEPNNIGKEASFGKNISYNHYKGFYNANTFVHVWFAESSDGQGDGFSYTETHAYDEETLEEIKLEDVFVDGFDYEALIKERLDNWIGESGTWELGGEISDVNERNELIDTFYEAIIEGGLCMSGYELQLCAPAKYGERILSPWISFDFKDDIGYENLTIFD